MYQQSPNVAGLQQQLQSLKTQLIYTQGNPTAQYQIQQQIALLENELRNAMAMNQQYGSYQQQPQPMYGQQQYRPNPYQQQPQFQQQQPSFAMPYQQPARSDTVSTTMAENSRYGNRNDEHLSRYAVQPPVHTKPDEVVVKQQINHIPLEGNEFPLLLADGLTANKTHLGDYFKYVVEGNQNFSYSTISVKDDSDIDVLKDTKERLYYLSKVNENATVFGAVKDSLISIDLTNDTLNKITSSFKEDLTYDSVVKLLGVLKGTSFSKLLDIHLTNRLNNLIKFYVNETINIDSVQEDLMEFVDEYIPTLTSVNSRKKFKDTVNMLLQYIKHCQITVNKLDDKYSSVTLTEVYDTVYLTNKVIEDIVINISEENVLTITQESHEYLYDMLEKLYESSTYFKDTKVAKLSYRKSNGEIVYHTVYKTTYNTYIFTGE